MKNHQKHKGFTLVELVIVIAIISVLSVIVQPLLKSGFDAYFTQRDLTDANWQGSLAMSRMTRDIHDIPSSSAITTINTTQFTFTDNTNTSVSYTLSGTTLLRNTQILANGVNSIAFAYYDSTGAITATVANIRYVNITLNITQNSSDLTLFTTINLRNLP